MEKTLAAIQADIASLRKHATAFRALAEHHRAGDSLVIADKLMQVVAELEQKATELDASLPNRVV